MPKASGGLRVCCDFRELNKAIVRERYVLPKLEDTLDALNGSKYFAKIDARSGFFQLSLSEECRHLTTFITNKGYFQFKRVPFGLSDISETFQKVMGKILFGLEGVETLSSIKYIWRWRSRINAEVKNMADFTSLADTWRIKNVELASVGVVQLP